MYSILPLLQSKVSQTLKQYPPNDIKKQKSTTNIDTFTTYFYTIETAHNVHFPFAIMITRLAIHGNTIHVEGVMIKLNRELEQHQVWLEMGVLDRRELKKATELRV